MPKTITLDLKPCPFCGNLPNVWPKEGKPEFAICATAGCPISRTVTDIRIESWNRRVAPAVREALDVPLRQADEGVNHLSASMLGELMRTPSTAWDKVVVDHLIDCERCRSECLIFQGISPWTKKVAAVFARMDAQIASGKPLIETELSPFREPAAAPPERERVPAAERGGDSDLSQARTPISNGE